MYTAALVARPKIIYYFFAIWAIIRELKLAVNVYVAEKILVLLIHFHYIGSILYHFIWLWTHARTTFEQNNLLQVWAYNAEIWIMLSKKLKVMTRGLLYRCIINYKEYVKKINKGSSVITNIYLWRFRTHCWLIFSSNFSRAAYT